MNNNRTLFITHRFHAPVELVWKLWSDPEQIIHWWGPHGFTNTIRTMEFVKGGEWNLIMHGPDGTNYPNKSIYLEIIPFQKIEFEHFNPHFITTVLFREIAGTTNIEWSMLFDTPEMFETVVRVHKADEGQQQNIEKLENYLQKIKQQPE